MLQNGSYNTKTVAENLRKARLYRNYSQDYLAYKLNISQNSYSKMELGYTRITLDRLFVIAEVLQVELSRLIEAPGIQKDIADVNQIEIIPRILEVVCHVTGLGFAAVARVTNEQWVACVVRDEINFGLKAGDELKLETTICHEIRNTGKAVIIDEVAADAWYAVHPTPAMYGFQSYISIPIVLADGHFFGTLCGIDSKPHQLSNPETVTMFKLFAELIGCHLNGAGFYKKSPAEANHSIYVG
jgi:transcriptional regulator with XRE-family HTH domain